MANTPDTNSNWEDTVYDCPHFQKAGSQVVQPDIGDYRVKDLECAPCLGGDGTCPVYARRTVSELIAEPILPERATTLEIPCLNPTPLP